MVKNNVRDSKGRINLGKVVEDATCFLDNHPDSTYCITELSETEATAVRKRINKTGYLSAGLRKVVKSRSEAFDFNYRIDINRRVK